MARIVLSLFALALLCAVGVFVGLTQPGPALPALPPPSAGDVTATRSIVHAIRRVSEGDGTDREVPIPVTAIGGAVRLGARFLPGLRAEAEIAGDAVKAAAAVPVPFPGGPRWLNLAATVPAFDGAIAPSAISVGPLDLPPGPTLDLARRVANLVLGQDAGDTILRSAEAMRIEGDTLVFTLRLNEKGRGEVAQGVFAALRGSALPAPERIAAAHAAIRTAMDAGTLPTEGSLLPHLRFTLDLARQDASDDTLADAYTAALLGLAKACGAVDFGPIVGRLAGSTAWDGDRWASTCEAVTLGGRTDTRQHFVVAAAIKAASNRGFAISLGEFKELNDSISGGSGFDFTDIAANNAGIRLSDRMMATPLADWPARLALLRTEDDVMPSLAGLPDRMTDAEFAARYGSVESAAYLEVMARIEARIDALPLHAAAR